eukprot:6176510-Amphidinium_carterae.1
MSQPVGQQLPGDSATALMSLEKDCAVMSAMPVKSAMPIKSTYVRESKTWTSIPKSAWASRVKDASGSLPWLDWLKAQVWKG